MADPVFLSRLDLPVPLVVSLPWGGGAIAGYFFSRQTRPLHTQRFFREDAIFKG